MSEQPKTTTPIESSVFCEAFVPADKLWVDWASDPATYRRRVLVSYLVTWAHDWGDRRPTEGLAAFDVEEAILQLSHDTVEQLCAALGTADADDADESE